MGANASSCGFGCDGEDDQFQPFQDTGGQVHVLVVALNYAYSPGNELTALEDAKTMLRICSQAHCEDVTTMLDTVKRDDPQYPTRHNVTKQLREIGSRTQPDDFFVFFFAGHGMNVPDHPPLDEEDGQDEALVLPGPRGEIAPEFFMIDDELVAAIEDSFNPATRLLFLFDCCHSATMVDIDTHQWQHRVCSIAACQDSEESADTGSGGVLTLAIESVMGALAVSRGSKEYSMLSLYDEVEKKGAALARRQGHKQELSMMYANMAPELTPWPLPRPWWRQFN